MMPHNFSIALTAERLESLSKQLKLPEVTLEDTTWAYDFLAVKLSKQV